jgi:hypothetical protein
MIMESQEFAAKALRIKCDDFDTVTAVFTDFGPQAGQIIITCWEDCWSCWFSAMGNRTIAQFVSECDNGYLENKLSGHKPNARQRRVLRKSIDLVKEALSALPVAIVGQK